LLAGAWAACAGGPFTYQGSLKAGSVPANGLYDISFTLYDAAQGGQTLAGPVTNSAVAVSGGLFTATVDFGVETVCRNGCWLELAVRTRSTGPPDPAGFTTLTPRQALTPAPLALFAQEAGAAATASSLAPGALAGVYPDTVQLIAPSNVFNGSFSGNGAGLTGLNGANILAQSISASRLDPLAWQQATNQSVPVINVKDFGASGDGTHDDTAALANAWSAFMTRGGTLFFPPGIYLDSGTHYQMNFVPNEPTSRNGWLILGLGGAIWRYTGTDHLLEGYLSFPDIDGIEFSCGNPSAKMAVYVSSLFNKWAIRNCVFNSWPNTTAGALVIDDADSVTLSSSYFWQCNIGLGLGYKCNGFKGDLEGGLCGTVVAIGVPTPNSPASRDSHTVSLNVMAIYCGATVAIDASSDATIRGFHYWSTNAILVGMIPGISTNYAPQLSVRLEQNYFLCDPLFHSPIQLFSSIASKLAVEDSIFLMHPSAPPLIRSMPGSGADTVPLEWKNSIQIGSLPQPIFVTSTGTAWTNTSLFESKLLNGSQAILTNRRIADAANDGYLLDVLYAAYAGPGHPIARFGANRTAGQFGDFWGGLTVRYDQAADIPTVDVTNSDLYVTGSRPGSGSTGGKLFVSGSVNATNGFASGSSAGLTTNVTVGGATFIYKGGILTGVQ
jgi:hypothetical protein